MSNETFKSFGALTTHSNEKSNPFGNTNINSNMNFIAKYNNKNNNTDDIKDIFNSAVGDFTERPLQIMIREIAKSFLIFTPIGWIILLFIIGRTYKNKLNHSYTKMSDVFRDAFSSLGLQK